MSKYDRLSLSAQGHEELLGESCRDAIASVTNQNTGSFSTRIR